MRIGRVKHMAAELSHNLKRLKRLYRKAQNLKRSKAKSEKKRKKRAREIVQAHREYTDEA